MKKIVVLLSLLYPCLILTAQKADVYRSIKSIVDATQKIISVERGQKIDTAYFKTLFLPSANFTVVGEEDGVKLYETMDLETFATSLRDDYYSNGYYEVGTGEVIEQYNGIAHVMQSFYGKDSEDEEARGVGSYQLVYSRSRWWIANMIWTMSANGGKDIPLKYLK